MRSRIHSLRVPGAVPGVTLRVILLGLVILGAALLVPFALWQGVAIVAGAASVIVPRSMAAWAAVGCLVFGMTLVEPAPAQTALAVLLVHAIHILGALSLTVPARSWMDVRMLAPTAMRFIVVQLIAQPLAFGVWLLSPDRTEGGSAWLAPMAALVLLAGVVIALRALRRADVSGPS